MSIEEVVVFYIISHNLIEDVSLSKEFGIGLQERKCYWFLYRKSPSLQTA